MVEYGVFSGNNRTRYDRYGNRYDLGTHVPGVTPGVNFNYGQAPQLYPRPIQPRLLVSAPMFQPQAPTPAPQMHSDAFLQSVQRNNTASGMYGQAAQAEYRRSGAMPANGAAPAFPGTAPSFTGSIAPPVGVAATPSPQYSPRQLSAQGSYYMAQLHPLDSQIKPLQRRKDNMALGENGNPVLAPLTPEEDRQLTALQSQREGLWQKYLDTQRQRGGLPTTQPTEAAPPMPSTQPTTQPSGAPPNFQPAPQVGGLSDIPMSAEILRAMQEAAPNPQAFAATAAKYGVNPADASTTPSTFTTPGTYNPGPRIPYGLLGPTGSNPRYSAPGFVQTQGYGTFAPGEQHATPGFTPIPSGQQPFPGQASAAPQFFAPPGVTPSAPNFPTSAPPIGIAASAPPFPVAGPPAAMTRNEFGDPALTNGPSATPPQQGAAQPSPLVAKAGGKFISNDLVYRPGRSDAAPEPDLVSRPGEGRSGMQTLATSQQAAKLPTRAMAQQYFMQANGDKNAAMAALKRDGFDVSGRYAD